MKKCFNVEAEISEPSTTMVTFMVFLEVANEIVPNSMLAKACIFVSLKRLTSFRLSSFFYVKTNNFSLFIRKNRLLKKIILATRVSAESIRPRIL